MRDRFDDDGGRRSASRDHSDSLVKPGHPYRLPICPDIVEYDLQLRQGADQVCRPEFDSPTVFCRLMDKNKGGYFSIHPEGDMSCTTKQQYLPSSNILQTRYIHENGVVDLVDFFPRPKNAKVIFKGPKQSVYREMTSVQEELKKWLVRRVECIRGEFSLGKSCCHSNALLFHHLTIVRRCGNLPSL